MRAYPVLAQVSLGYSKLKGTFPRVTHPSATDPEGPVRLACVKPAASVRSEPGSNSQVERFDLTVTTLQLTESISLRSCRSKRCTHQSIDQVVVLSNDQKVIARTPPPTLLLPSSLVKEHISSRRDKKENPGHPTRLAAPGASGPLQTSASLPRPPSMKWVLIEPGFQVNTQFRQNLTFLSVHLSLKSTDKAKSFPEDGFLLRYTDRGPGPRDEYLDFAPEEPSGPQIAPQPSAHEQGICKALMRRVRACVSRNLRGRRHDIAPEQWLRN